MCRYIEPITEQVSKVDPLVIHNHTFLQSVSFQVGKDANIHFIGSFFFSLRVNLSRSLKPHMCKR